MPSSLTRGTRRLNQSFWNLRTFVIIGTTCWFTTVLGFHWNNRIPPQVLGALCFGEHKQGLSSFIWSVSASWRLSNSGSSPSFISSIRLGIKNKPANSVKWVMYGCWEIQIASSVGASKVMSLYRMRSQHHALILCVSFILYAWGRAKAWVHWRDGEVLRLNPLASRGSTLWKVQIQMTVDSTPDAPVSRCIT